MVIDIDPKSFLDILEREKDGWEIVDVREQSEWDAGHIQGAKLLPIGEIIVREDEIDWDKKVLFYCRSGNRSGQAADYFSGKGKDSWNLEGGVLDLPGDFPYLVK